jgi:predicted hydrocarbon binding protein
MSATQELRAPGSVKAALPLALLESVRAHDRPEEILEDEDLTVSLPRRLGLTGVIDTQMRRYQSAPGKSVTMEEFASLVRLVLKRPDADTILRDTGQRMAALTFERVPQSYLRMLRSLPKRLMIGSWRRTARRMMREMTGETRAEIAGRPPVVRLKGGPLARLEPQGAACSLYSAALERLGELFVGSSVAVVKTRCDAHGGMYCEWSVTL